MITLKHGFHQTQTHKKIVQSAPQILETLMLKHFEVKNIPFLVDILFEYFISSLTFKKIFQSQFDILFPYFISSLTFISIIFENKQPN